MHIHFFFGHHLLFLLCSSYLIGMKRCGTVLRSAAGVTCPHIGSSACHERCHRSSLPRGDCEESNKPSSVWSSMGNHQSIWLVHCCFTNILLLGWKDTTWLNSKKKLRFTNCGLLASFAARHTRWMGWNDTMGSPKIGSFLLILKMNSVDLLIHATDSVTILYTHALHNSINVPCWDKTSLPDWFNSCIPKCYPYWLPMNLGSSRYRIRGKNSTLTPFLWLSSAHWRFHLFLLG